MVKGLALYRSLERVSDDFHLYVMAFDKDCYDRLNSLKLPHMTIELIDDIETPELLQSNQLEASENIVGHAVQL